MGGKVCTTRGEAFKVKQDRRQGTAKNQRFLQNKAALPIQEMGSDARGRTRLGPCENEILGFDSWMEEAVLRASACQIVKAVTVRFKMPGCLDWP